MEKKDFLIIVIAALASVALMAGFYLLNTYVLHWNLPSPQDLREYLQRFGNYAVLVFFFLYILNAVVIATPLGPISLAAGLVFGTVWGMIYLYFAGLIGASLAFFVGRHLVRRLIEPWLISKPFYKRVDGRLERKGFVTILFFRVVPIIPYEWLNYAGGLSRMKFQDFFWATAIGLIPGTVVAVLFGDAIGDAANFKDLLRPQVIGATIFFIVIVAVPLILIHLRKQRRARRNPPKV